MQRSTLAKRHKLLFLLSAIAFYLYGLGHFPFVGPDEPRYAQVAREMFLRGDPVTPTLGGHTWFEKPVLLYWMIEASFALFGISEGAARLGPAFAGIISVLLVYWTSNCARRASAEGSQEEASGLALACGLVLATSGGMIVFSRAASFDIVLTMAVSMSLACFFGYEVEKKERRRRWLLAGCYACVGLALLAKGLVGIVIPCGVVAGYLLLRREWPRPGLWLSLLWGAAIALAVAGLWYGPIIARHGWKFVDEFFIQHHFARYVSNKYHHTQPFYFYVPIMALLAVPWTCFLVSALWSLRALRWRGEAALDRMRVFSFAWLLVPVVFFSLSGSKLPGYVLPALPGAALLAGERLWRFMRGEGERKTMRATGIMLIVFALVFLAYARWTGDVALPCALAAGLLVLAAGTGAIFWTGKRGLCVGLVTCAVVGVCLLGLNCGAERIVQRESMRDLLRAADAQGFAATPLYQLHTIEHSSEFYAAGRVVRDERGEILWLESPAEVERVARGSNAPVLVIVSLWRLPQLTSYAPLDTHIIGDNGQLVLTVVKVREQSVSE